uniref:Protein NLRC3-like n=1 Tax=Phallusia mammillata TaxID=59560 RepID=A0A6F9DLN0_9ASCI|nr:protein NLRC3-like [Phallusia mammillata]
MHCDALITDEQTDAKEVAFPSFAVPKATQRHQNQSFNNNRLHSAQQTPMGLQSLSETSPKWFVSSQREQQSTEERQARIEAPAPCTDDYNETDLKGVMPSTKLESVESIEEESYEILPESFDLSSSDEEVIPKQVIASPQGKSRNEATSLGFQPESFDFNSQNSEVKPKKIAESLYSSPRNCVAVHEESSLTEPKCPFSSNQNTHGGTEAQTDPKQIVIPPKHGQSMNLANMERHIPLTNSGGTNHIYLGDVVTHVHQESSKFKRLVITSKVNDLIQHLKENAEEMCADIDTSLDDTKVSRAVKLQVSTYNGETAKQLNEMGHFCHRDEFEYVFSSPKGDVALENIFSYAENASRTKGKRANKRAANRILIIGQAGIGKTVLTKMLTHLVLQGALLPGCKFIFYIRFRDIDCDENRSLLEILLSSCGCEWEHSKEADSQLWELLTRNPNVLIVLDGLDEAKGREMLQQAPKCNPLSRNKVSTQLKNLIGGNSLPEAKLVVTSRPRDGNGLHPDHKPRTVLQVIGLDENAQDDLGNDVCGEDWSDVKSFIHENPQVQGICYVPVFCVLVMKILCANLSGRGNITLSSLTKILVAALDNYATSENVKENGEDFSCLALLAFLGFRRRNYMFEEIDLQAAGIRDHGCQSFLSTWESNNRVRILQMGKKSYFSHLVWQELFTAIYLLFYASQADFEKFLRRLHKRRWEVVARCLYGLCNQEVFPIMRQNLGLKRTRLMSWKIEQLRRHAMDSLKGITNNAVNTQDKLESLIGVCTWFYELGDPRGIGASLPQKVVLHGNIYPADVASLMYCLKESFNPVVMNIRYPTQFVGKSMQMLFTEIQDSPVTLRHLTLTRNKISDETSIALANCLRSPKTVNIDRTEMSEFSIVTIMKAIEKLPQPLSEINLTENIITDDAAEAISHAIVNINIIIMRNCRLSPNGFRMICRKIKSRSGKMDEFYVRANHVTDEVAAYIAECVHLIKRLYVHECKVTVNGAKILAGAIKKLECPIDELYLHFNPFGDLGAIHIASCLHKIRYGIRLDKCGCTSSGYEEIHEAYQDAQNKPEVYLGHIDEQLNDVKLERTS